MWLLHDLALGEIGLALQGSKVTAEQQAEYEALDRSEGILNVVGGAGEIPITGVLTQSPDFFMRYFGGGNTTYPEIISAVATAEADPLVKEIILSIDSPGGQISGLFNAVDALQGAKKPIKAVIHNLGASAAYALASQAGTIEAANRASMIGSVGIAATFYVSDTRVTVTSSKAPKKVPDVTTAKGKATVVKELDAIHEIFVDSIATGRKVSSAKVNKDFGQGAVLLAGEALKAGMIDSVLGQVANVGSDKTEEAKMNIAELKAQHPEVYAEVFDSGVAKERDRAMAHLTMGESYQAMGVAVKAVESGDALSDGLLAQYLTAGRNAKDVSDREGDEKEATAGDGVTPEGSNADDMGESVIALVEQATGVEV